jgi:hypothetical protein
VTSSRVRSHETRALISLLCRSLTFSVGRVDQRVEPSPGHLAHLRRTKFVHVSRPSSRHRKPSRNGWWLGSDGGARSDPRYVEREDHVMNRTRHGKSEMNDLNLGQSANERGPFFVAFHSRVA